MHEIFSLKNITKKYSSDTLVLDDVSLQVMPSEFVALLGPSGSGKSTLLHIAGLLDSPSSGKIFINETDTSRLSDNEKTLIRLHKIGFVYQYHHLLQEFSAIENVMIPMLIAHENKKYAKEKAESLLEDLGLKKKIHASPSELSGGQKQRVAIARALANDPLFLLADEPTGNLDPETAELIFQDLMRILEKTHMSGIIATHNYNLARQMHKQYAIDGGKLIQR